ncbi:MAG: FAD-dependent monooxygenase [Propionibacteriaceae bacterium]|nr:FAD-dependent monooxygenase [Propionibacteriaceae bacterium]
MNTRYDVTVIGAGPIGLTAALILAKGGASVAVVEVMDKPGDMPRAISIVAEALRILDRLGLAGELEADSYLDTGAKYFGLNDRLLATSKPVPSKTGHPAKSQFDQPVMEQLLWDQALATPGLTFLTGTRATAIAQDGDQVTVTVTTAAGASQDLRSSWLVAADGGKSFVRSALDIPLLGSTQPERWIVIDLLNVPGSRTPYAEFHGDGERPYVMVPGTKGRLRLEYMLFKNEDATAMTSPEGVAQLVRRWQPNLKPEDIRRANVYLAHQRVARDYRVDRVFLIGDAAHLMPPFSGQGLNSGMRDAMNASWKILEAVRGRATNKLLDSYSTERRTHGAKMVNISHRTGSVVMAAGKVAPIARDVFFTVAKLVPPVHQYLSDMRFITLPDYSDGVAAPPAEDVDKELAALVGKSLPQPQVSGADGVQTGLDARLGDDWALLALGPTLSDPWGIVDPYWTDLCAVKWRLRPLGTNSTLDASDLLDLTGWVAKPTQQLKTTHYLVIRPDRYVAAVFTAEDDTVARERLRSFVRPPHQPPSPPTNPSMN